jgi:hypothetical protein
MTEVKVDNAFAAQNGAYQQDFRLTLLEVPSVGIAPGTEKGETNTITTIRRFTMSLYAVTLPAIDIGESPIRGWGVKATNRGFVAKQADLECSYLVDESYFNYNLFLGWVMLQKSPALTVGIGDEMKLAESKYFTTGILHILNSSNNVIGEYTFYDIHPTETSSLALSYQTAGALTAAVKFAYSYYLPTGKFAMQGVPQI